MIDIESSECAVNGSSLIDSEVIHETPESITGKADSIINEVRLGCTIHCAGFEWPHTEPTLLIRRSEWEGM